MIAFDHCEVPAAISLAHGCTLKLYDSLPCLHSVSALWPAAKMRSKGSGTSEICKTLHVPMKESAQSESEWMGFLEAASLCADVDRQFPPNRSLS